MQAVKATPRSKDDTHREVVAFLSRPESYGTAAQGGAVERIDTHCSAVFLVGEVAYKLKLAIVFASLDYTTIERREAACRAELALNRRTAPDLYLGVRSVNRSGSGVLAFDGPGPAIDWVVVMRRFSQDDLFSRMAGMGRLTPALMRRLGEEIARLHGIAEAVPTRGGRDGIRRAIDDNHGELLRFTSVLEPPRLEALRTASIAALESMEDVLERRRQAGKVRRGHGDLRLANICLFEGRPTLFDCVEFSEDVGCVDVLHDLAFLLMDLERRELAALANVVLNTYLDRTGDIGGLVCLPLFLSVRAATRCFSLAGKAARESDPDTARDSCDMARAHLARARSFLDPPPPLLVAVSGPSGQETSRVAEDIAPHVPPAPGARIVHVAEAGATFEQGLAHVAATLAAAHSAVVDAPASSAARCESIADVARRAGAPFVGFRLAPPGEAARAPVDPPWLDVTASQGLPVLLSTIQRMTSRTGAREAAANMRDLDGDRRQR